MDTPTYEKKVSNFFTTAAIQMALELANDVGILDILYSAEQPLTSKEIAEQGKLKERYVREILGSLATAEVIQVDETSSKFHIPEQLKDVLRKLMIYGKLITAMRPRMEVMKKIVTENGPDGTRYDDALFAALEERNKLSQDDIIDSDMLACVPDVKDQLEKGIRVAEFGCAEGIILLNLAKRYPKSTFLGSDISETRINKARKQATERELKNISFDVYDLFELPEAIHDNFDWIFLQDTLHDLPSPSKALQSMKQALKKDGTLSLYEIGMKGTLVDNVGDIYWAKMYAISTFFCIPESFQRHGSEAFGACWGVEKARKLIAESGFTLVQELFKESSPGSVHYVCKRSQHES